MIAIIETANKMKIVFMAITNGLLKLSSGLFVMAIYFVITLILPCVFSIARVVDIKVLYIIIALIFSPLN